LATRSGSESRTTQKREFDGSYPKGFERVAASKKIAIDGDGNHIAAETRKPDRGSMTEPRSSNHQRPPTDSLTSGGSGTEMVREASASRRTTHGRRYIETNCLI